jgi:high-affinity iron transporter
MALLAGSATLREGIESVLFLTGVSAGLSPASVLLPGAIGLALGTLVGVAVYFTGRSIKSLKWFFVASSVLLLFIAAGMTVNGAFFFQLAGLFGTMWPYEWRPWSNLLLWDASACCSADNNAFFGLMRALFGWQDQAMNIQLVYYFMYWALVLPLLFFKIHQGALIDRAEAGAARGGSAGSSDDGKGKLTPASEEADAVAPTDAFATR